MKIRDLPALTAGLVLVLFFAVPATRDLYAGAYAAAPWAVSFVKFALLATAGEMLVLRLRRGHYYERQFGIGPKMVIWGLIGVTIWAAFGVFSAGTASLFPGLAGRAAGGAAAARILLAFLISLFMNLVYAPPMMLVHHLTDRFIEAQGGGFPVARWDTAAGLRNADWDRLWGFVYRKTLPLFWVPAHTVTFLLPPAWRTLFAALLSVALGLLLALASRRGEGN